MMLCACSLEGKAHDMMATLLLACRQLRRAVLRFSTMVFATRSGRVSWTDQEE